MEEARHYARVVPVADVAGPIPRPRLVGREPRRKRANAAPATGDGASPDFDSDTPGVGASRVQEAGVGFLPSSAPLLVPPTPNHTPLTHTLHFFFRHYPSYS